MSFHALLLSLKVENHDWRELLNLFPVVRKWGIKYVNIFSLVGLLWIHKFSSFIQWLRRRWQIWDGFGELFDASLALRLPHRLIRIDIKKLIEKSKITFSVIQLLRLACKTVAGWKGNEWAKKLEYIEKVFRKICRSFHRENFHV